MSGQDASGRVEDRTASVVIVDDEPDLVFLVEKLLTRSGFEVVGTSRDGRAGIETIADHQPDAALLDLSMPHLDGASALPDIIKQAPRTMVAILSAHLDADKAEELMYRGAFAAYDKGDLGRLPEILEEDLASFRRVLDGEDELPPVKRRYRRL